ncbi:hypothetical protein JHK87_023374 [Glycine soja]|nr:hypothetical protein JHK87_023374 [Glycine soja]
MTTTKCHVEDPSTSYGTTPVFTYEFFPNVSSGNKPPNFIPHQMSMTDLDDIRKDVECPICLGIIRNTRVVMECMHRFCRDCIEKSFRLGNNECPACRTHCSSRRSLREDPNFDNLIGLLYSNIDKYEEEVVLKRMQKAYAKTYERQSIALGKKPAAATSTKRSKAKFLRSSSSRPTRRSPRNIAAAFAGSSSSRERALPPIAEEEEIEEVPDTDISESEIEAQTPQHVPAATKTVHGTNEAVKDIISSADKLVWGKSAQRSNNRSNSRNVAALRSNRIARFIDHLKVSQENDDELDIFIKLVSFEEKRVPNLPRPYLSCRPTLSIKQLCQYVALETSLQTEEIELYLVKECQPDIISGDGKLDEDNNKFEFLAEEEVTMAQLKTNNLSFGHLVIAYKRKRWNLNEGLFLG